MLSVRSRVERQYTIQGLRHPLAIRIDIEDDGPGVPVHLRERLFLPLVSGRSGGCGLGLAIAQDLIQRQGGLIEWRSRPGQTAFRFSCRLWIRTMTTEGVSVWVVDDDDSMRWVMEKALRKESYQAQSFARLEDLRLALKKEIPQALIMDIRLPDGDGIRFLPEWIGHYPDRPVIVVTAHADFQN
ncbi:ATP-binding region, ATPase-like domain protein, partial [mine drainage metagenome]